MTLPDQLISHSSLHHLCLLRWLYISLWPLSPGDISHSHSFLHCWSPQLEHKLCLVSAVSPGPQHISSTNYCAVWMDTGEFFPSIMITLGVVYSWWLKWKIWIYDKSYGRKYQIGGLKRYYPMENYRENSMDKEEQSLLLTYVELSCVLGPLLETFTDTFYLIGSTTKWSLLFSSGETETRRESTFSEVTQPVLHTDSIWILPLSQVCFLPHQAASIAQFKTWSSGFESKTTAFLAYSRGFPSSPVVRISGFHCWGQGLVPGWETKIPQVAQHSHKKTYQSPNNTKYTCMSLFIAVLSIIENYSN